MHLDMEEPLHFHESRHAAIFLYGQLVPHDRTMQHNFEHDAPVYPKPPSLCIRSNGRHVLLRCNANGDSGEQDAHPPQVCAAPHMRLSWVQSMVYLTVPQALSRHQRHHRFGRRAALRYIQVQTPCLDNSYCHTTRQSDQGHAGSSDRHPGPRQAAT